MPYSILPKLFTKNGSDKGVVKLQIIINSKKTIKTTGIKVLSSQWKDEQVINHEHAQKLNTLIRNKYSEWERKILDLELSGVAVSVKSIASQRHIKLVPFIESMIETKQNRLAYGTIKGYKQELKRLQKFDPEITFNKVDNTWLRKYEELLSETMENNTIHKSFTRLKAVFNAAIKEGLTKHYPFTNYDGVKYIDPEKIFLTEKEVMQFWEAIDENPLTTRQELSGYYFLLGCFSGLRVSDWLRFDKRFVEGDRLRLRAKKNGELVTMKMHTRLKKIVKYILKHGKPVTEQKLREHIKVITKLAKIEKDVSTHSGRRTFACLCAVMGISPQVCAELMGISLKTVWIYYKISGVTLDKEIKKFG